MNKFITLSTSTAVLLYALLIAGCSSSDDGGTTTTARVPANAIVIDATNAETTVQAATSSTTTLGSTISVETTQVLSLKSALNTIRPKLKNISTANVAAGVDFSEPCTDGGSISGSETSTDDGTTYTESGTASFNNCIEGSLTINGAISFAESGNYVTGAFTDDISGSITMTFNGGSDSFSFSGFVFSETGNKLNFTYTINELTYTIDFIISGTQGGGFLVGLLAPIVESNGFGCPESGHILITGANGTTAEGIYNNDGTMTIKANGADITTASTCYM